MNVGSGIYVNCCFLFKGLGSTELAKKIGFLGCL